MLTNGVNEPRRRRGPEALNRCQHARTHAYCKRDITGWARRSTRETATEYYGAHRLPGWQDGG